MSAASNRLGAGSIVAERIRKKVEPPSMTASNETFAVAVSIGVASATLGMSGSTLSCVDQGLYEGESLKAKIALWNTTPIA